MVAGSNVLTLANYSGCMETISKYYFYYVLSHIVIDVQLFAALWTVACQAAVPMGFSRQEYWNGFPFPTSRDLSHPSIEPVSPALASRLYH